MSVIISKSLSQWTTHHADKKVSYATFSAGHQATSASSATYLLRLREGDSGDISGHGQGHDEGGFEKLHCFVECKGRELLLS